MMMLPLPPGARFAPTDDELITHYLHKKINGEPFPPNFVIERDLYGMSPWNVLNNPADPRQTSKVRNKAGHVVGTDRVIYVITKLKKASECRISRVAGCGVWHGEGGPFNIHDDNGVIIGTEKTYAFQVMDKSQERIPPEGHWIMHEISACTGTDNNYVICNISRDDTKSPKEHKKLSSAKRERPSRDSLGEEDNSVDLLQGKKLKMNNQEAKDNQEANGGNTHTNEAAAQLEATEEDKNNNDAASQEDEVDKYTAEFDAEIEAKEENNNNNNNVACNDDEVGLDDFAAGLDAELEQEVEEETNNNNILDPPTQVELAWESILEDPDFREEYMSNLRRNLWNEESDKQVMSNAMWNEFDEQMRLLQEYPPVDWTN